MPESSLDIINLTVSYGSRTVLRNVTLALPPGISASMIGPNGAGKSTLLNAALGMIKRDSGDIMLFGKPYNPKDGLLAFIPQKELIDWDFPVQVKDVVMMGRYAGLGWFGRPGREDRNLVSRALEQVGMEEYADRHIRLLSGGQQQRIFIARALAQQAEVLVMDEPFAGVDASTESTILDLMDNLCEQGKTVVMVNHDLNLLNRFDWVIMINNGLIAAGPTGETYNERNRGLTYGPTLNEIDRAEQIISKGVAK
ncbi:metal ABC transporter ATP-binding protein [Gemmatimonadota bacterium]